MQTKKFKFFRGEGKSSEHYDSQLTAHTINHISHFAGTSSNLPILESNNEMERYYAEYFQSPTYGSHMEMIRQNRNQGRMSREEILRRRHEGFERERVNNPIRLSQATTTITVNPTLWTKVKIFGTQVKLFFKECWQHEPIGLIFVTILFCLVSFIGIMKLFGA